MLLKALFLAHLPVQQPQFPGRRPRQREVARLLKVTQVGRERRSQRLCQASGSGPCALPSGPQAAASSQGAFGLSAGRIPLPSVVGLLWGRGGPVCLDIPQSTWHRPYAGPPAHCAKDMVTLGTHWLTPCIWRHLLSKGFYRHPPCISYTGVYPRTSLETQFPHQVSRLEVTWCVLTTEVQY